jgi:hypothetical protein
VLPLRGRRGERTYAGHEYSGHCKEIARTL